MPKTYGGAFSRKGPDVITEQLAVVLSAKASFEFKPLFDILQANLKERNAANGGEEMLRLRAYEKLQSLVNRGLVKKTITKTRKEYTGLAALASALPVVPTDAPAPV
jgi:hypothetical protein